MINCSWSNVDLGWRCGEIFSMCKEAIEIAKLLNTKVSFEFNKVRVNVSKSSSANNLAIKALAAAQAGKTSVYGEGC